MKIDLHEANPQALRRRGRRSSSLVLLLLLQDGDGLLEVVPGADRLHGVEVDGADEGGEAPGHDDVLDLELVHAQDLPCARHRCSRLCNSPSSLATHDSSAPTPDTEPCTPSLEPEAVTVPKAEFIHRGRTFGTLNLGMLVEFSYLRVVLGFWQFEKFRRNTSCCGEIFGD